MTPSDLANIGRALYGRGYRPSLASALDVSDSALDAWLSGTRTMPPGLRADLIRIIRQHRDMLAEHEAALVAGLGNLHGLTRREVAFVGWCHSVEWHLRDDWPDGITPARLAGRVREALADDRVTMQDGEAERLVSALRGLTERQARDVLLAARDLDELLPPGEMPDD